MREQELTELLSIHADGLRQEIDLSDDLLGAESEPGSNLLRSLLLLARRVQAALRPVEPRRDFVSEFGVRLRAKAREAQVLLAHRDADRRRWIWAAAALGGLLYFIGMAVVSVRLALAIFSFVAGLLGWRLVRAPQAKTRVAP